MLRLLGGRSLTTRPSMRICPASMSISPASWFSVVLLRALRARMRVAALTPSCGCVSNDRSVRQHFADWFRDALKDKGLRACIPSRKQRKTPVKYDKRRYKRRNRIEIMFGRLKDWRRVATRYDRCPKVFLSAIMLAAIVIYWL